LPPYRTAYLISTNAAAGGRIELQPTQVHVGITDNKDYEILEGLKEGDVVAVGTIGGSAAMMQQANNPFGGPFGGRGGRR
jgi:hypothetical protein